MASFTAACNLAKYSVFHSWLLSSVHRSSCKSKGLSLVSRLSDVSSVVADVVKAVILDKADEEGMEGLPGRPKE